MGFSLNALLWFATFVAACLVSHQNSQSFSLLLSILMVSAMLAAAVRLRASSELVIFWPLVAGPAVALPLIASDTATRIAIAISTVALAVSTLLTVVRSKDRTFLVLAMHMCAWLTFVYDPSTRFFYLADATAELISCFVAFGACSFIVRQQKGIAPYGLILFWTVELSLVVRNFELRAWGFGWHVQWDLMLLRS